MLDRFRLSAGLEDPSLEVRYLSLQLAAYARDESIKQKVFDIFRQASKQVIDFSHSCS